MFQTGDPIRFRYTGARARILTDYLDGSYKVLLLQDNEEIIAFRDDIIPEKDFKAVEKSAVEKEIGEQKLKKLSTEDLFYSKEELEKKRTEKLRQNNQVKLETKPLIESIPQNKSKEYHIPVFKETAPRNSGVWLAFADQGENSYIVYLVNDSNFSFNFEFSLNLEEKSVQHLKQHIDQYSYFALAEFDYAMLNDSPIIELNCPGLNLKEILRLKYKKWISMQQEVPLIGINCRAHLMFSTSRMSNIKPVGTDNLKKYTEAQLKSKPKDHQQLATYNKVEQLANFDNELDLHAEVLIPNYKSLSSAEIHAQQKLAMEKYMLHAIELGVPELFIIHGLGEGVLRKTVETYLSELKRAGKIKTFSNEYISKYGFGATKVRV
jgi:hypothetical protein